MILWYMTYMTFIYMILYAYHWASHMYRAFGSLNIQVPSQCSGMFLEWGDATKQLEQQPQSHQRCWIQTTQFIQFLPYVMSASGRKSDEHMSKPLMRSPKSRYCSARVCYSWWGSEGIHFYNYAGPQTKKSHAFSFVFWCIQSVWFL